MNKYTLRNYYLHYLKLLLFTLHCVFFSVVCHAQQTLSGTVNSYSAVTDTDSCLGTLVVSTTAGFNVGDKILLIQTKGADIDKTNTATFGTILNYNNAGVYEFNRIASITGNNITLQFKILNSYDILLGRVQLVKVPEYTDVTVTGTLTGQAWNGITGGVIVLDVSGTLTLNADIDASEIGFRGGDPSLDYYTGCSGENDYFYTFPSGFSGEKGEGITEYAAAYQSGRGRMANGGGGGNVVNTGGAGGGNYGGGGRGGDSNGCSANPWGGESGSALNYASGLNKLFMGGAGGGGQQNNTEGKKGANGGGIIIIRANNITSTGFGIKANGQAAPSAGKDGAGGGGAGGSILLAIQNYQSPLTLSANGANGGNMTQSTCHGPGGGGGGGAVAVSGGSMPTQLTVSVAEGTAGSAGCGGTHGAANGQPGNTVVNYQIPESTLPNSSGTVKVSNDTTLCGISALTLSATGGLSYLWSTSETTGSIDVLPTSATLYIVTITTAKCDIIDSIQVDVEEGLILSPVVYPVSCTGNTDGAAKIKITGSSTSYSYVWSPNVSTTDTAYGLSAGTYSVTVTETGPCSPSGTELVVNGDFQSGNTGFSSSYSYATSNCCEGQYGIMPGQNIKSQWNGGQSSSGDHTNGSGNLMVVNASPLANASIWCQTVTLTPNTDYIFSTWISSVNTKNPAKLQFSINGSNLGSVFNAPSALNNWAQFYTTWNSGQSTSATICIVNQNTAASGNDFALDDISFQECISSCPTVTTFTITAPDTIKPDFSFNNSCEGENILFTNQSSTTSGNLVSSEWNFGDNNSSQSASSASHAYTGDGQYDVKLVVTSDGGCSDSVTKKVTIFPLPSVNFTLQGKECLNDTAYFVNTSTLNTGNIVTWHWDFGTSAPSTGSGADTANTKDAKYLYADSAGVYQVTLIAVSDSGCADTVVQNIPRYPMPDVNFTPDTVCLNDSTQFEDKTTISSGTIQNWIWLFSPGLSFKQNPYHFFPLGNHDVTLIATSDKGCNDTLTKKVGVYPLPKAGFYYSDSCFNAQPVVFTDTSKAPSGSSLIKWEWDLDASLVTGSTINHTFLSSGTYTIELTVTTDKTCTDTAKKTITIHPAPIPDFSAATTQGCEPLCVYLTDNTSGAATSTWEWNLGTSTGSVPSVSNPVACYDQEGSYSVSLKVISDKGCKDSIFKSDYITVFPLPVAEFLVSPQPTTVLDTEIDFTDNSLGNLMSHQWLFYGNDKYTLLGDTTLANPQFTFPPDTGSYPVKLIVITTDGCVDSIIHYVIIDPDFVVYVPTAFTPDADGINDTFFPKGVGIHPTQEFNFYIFNRWGDLLFQSHELNKGWDGIAHEQGGTEVVQRDVYSWKLEFTDFTERKEKHQYVGHVSVIY